MQATCDTIGHTGRSGGAGPGGSFSRPDKKPTEWRVY